jgi:hypothetical protein
MKRAETVVVFFIFSLLAIGTAYGQTSTAHVPPCSACGLRAPEFDFREIALGITLIVGTTLLFAEGLRRSRKRS